MAVSTQKDSLHSILSAKKMLVEHSALVLAHRTSAELALDHSNLQALEQEPAEVLEEDQLVVLQLEPVNDLVDDEAWFLLQTTDCCCRELHHLLEDQY